MLAKVDELGGDITLEVSAGSLKVAVESQLQGEGIELAVLDVHDAGPVTVTLRGPAEMLEPSHVRLVVTAMPRSALADPATAARVVAWRAFTDGTRAGMDAIGAREQALPRIDEAIYLLGSEAAHDPMLAAMATLAKARALYYHEIDWSGAYREAARAADLFSAGEVANPLFTARARRLAAAALQEIVHDRDAVAPDSSQANVEARRLYAELIKPDSVLDGVGRARALNSLAIMDLDAQAWASSQANFEAAIGEYRRNGHRAGELQSMRNLVALSNFRGDYMTAAQAYMPLLANIDRVPDPDAQVTLLVNSSGAEINAGLIDRAIAHALRADQLARDYRLQPGEARALHSLALAYWAQGDAAQAKAFLDRSLALKQALNDAPGVFDSLRVLGALSRESGDLPAALDYHLKCARRAVSPMARVRASIELSRDYALLGRIDESVAAAESALKISLEHPRHPVHREAELVLAEAMLNAADSAAGLNARALQLARSALKAAADAGDLAIEMGAHRVIARYMLARKKPQDAKLHLESAVTLALRYSRSSSNPELRTLARSYRRQVFLDLVDLQMRAGAPDSDRLAALRTIEQMRELNFSDGRRSNPGILVKPGLERALEQLATRHIRVAMLRASSDPDERDLDALALEMGKLRAQIDSLRAGEGNLSGSGEELNLEWSEPGPREAQLSFLLGSKAVYLWRRDAQGTRSWTLSTPTLHLRREIARTALLDPLQQAAARDSAFQKLGMLLLPAGSVTTMDSDLRIAADGELSLVPFGALQSPSDASRRLGETQTITMTPSLMQRRVADTAAANRKWHLVAVSGSERGSRSGTSRAAAFPELRGSSQEVDAILKELHGSADDAAQSKILRGQSARPEEIRQVMQEGANVLHFATHGLSNVEQPLASLLVLSSDVSRPDQLLTAGQIQEWHANIGLVFLSGCSTALGPVRFASGMPGLQQAFLTSGAEQVIATLIPIEDSLARDFAVQFYEALGQGLSPARALVEVQRQWMSSEPAGSAQKEAERRVAAWSYVLYSRQ